MFVKTNTTGFADALTCEAEGLESLRELLVQVGVEHLRIPQVAEVDQYKLVMTQIVSVAPNERGQALLGEGLARLHQQEREHYGWGRDNYIGLSPQPNGLTESWGQFFVDYRLRYQVSRIADPVIRERFQRVVDQSSAALTRWLDSHCKHPSLLHGDLWRGNVLFDHDGPWLIDPAVYQGDREADIAMTEMFGGFGAAFYRAYDSVYPRSEVYTTKREIYNLYHYLNHYNLFGGGYLGGCERGMAVVAGFKS